MTTNDAAEQCATPSTARGDVSVIGSSETLSGDRGHTGMRVGSVLAYGHSYTQREKVELSPPPVKPQRKVKRATPYGRKRRRG